MGHSWFCRLFQSGCMGSICEFCCSKRHVRNMEATKQEIMKNFLYANWFLLAVAIFLLGALGDWPYAYYQLLRWVVCSVGTYSAYMAYTQERRGWTGIFVVIAILFNPIMP